MTTSNGRADAEDTSLASEELVGSRTVRTGYLSGPGFVDAPVRYSVVNGLAIYNGCIDMGPADEVEAHAAQVRARLTATTSDADSGVPPTEMKGVGLPPDSGFLWTNGVVPFVVDAGLPSPDRVTAAIAHIHENTGIRLVARTNQSNYVRFVRNPDAGWSSSAVGMRGGEQLIRLSDGASMGTVVHECCHALGVLHEQSRCDRDGFVKIHYENIEDGFESNFDKFCEGYDDYFDYDYESIMHYPAGAFSKNGQPTIETLQPGVTIGQRTGLSFGDRITISHMYVRFTGRGHTGVWRSGNGRYALWVNSSWDSFVAKWQEWAGQGLRLVDIDVRRVGNENRYSGVWLPGTGGYGLWANASWDSFVAKWQEWAGQGLRLVDINVHQEGGQNRYSGVWLPGTGGYGLWANASWEGFVAKWKEWAGQGLRLVDIDVHREGGQNRYSGAWLPGTDGYYLWADVPWESFRARWQQLGAKGLRLVDYEFAEPSAADPALDIAGAPVAASTAQNVPVGAGGIVDDAGTFEPEQRAAAAMNADLLGAAALAGAADGQGGYHPDGDTSDRTATATGPDGHGEAHPNGTPADPPAGTDGVGHAVTGADAAPVALAEVFDGLGAAISGDQPAVASRRGRKATRA
ncbi:MAG: M12 family metallopeptidase [Pseudonocardiaceae bacterium]